MENLKKLPLFGIILINLFGVTLYFISFKISQLNILGLLFIAISYFLAYLKYQNDINHAFIILGFIILILLWYFIFNSNIYNMVHPTVFGLLIIQIIGYTVFYFPSLLNIVFFDIIIKKFEIPNKFKISNKEELEKEDTFLLSFVSIIQTILIIDFSFNKKDDFRLYTLLFLILFALLRGFAYIKNNNLSRFISSYILICIIIMDITFLLNDNIKNNYFITFLTELFNIPINFLILTFILYLSIFILILFFSSFIIRYIKPQIDY